MLAVLASLSLLAAQLLDFDMTREEQKATGVYKLTDNQKQALQRWIDRHYTRREEPLVENANHAPAVLSENLQNGRYIRLSDRTTWEINPNDTALTQGWITPAEIIISQSGDSNYPYKLTNSLTGSSVKARKVSRVP